MSTAYAPRENVSRWESRLFLAFVAVLPIHTVFLSAWISWKPFLIALVALVVIDVTRGLRERRWPYNPPVSIALAMYGALLLVGYPSEPYRERFFQLGLAIAVGAMVMLVTDRHLRQVGIDRVLDVIFWTGAAMGATAVALSIVNFGVFGAEAINVINDIPGVFRTSKPAYLKDGFIALTNWHQDPGYGAAWAVLWASLVMVAGSRGRGAGRLVDGAVVGGLGFAVLMAFSRTGWLSFPLAMAIVGTTLVRSQLVTWRWLASRLSVAALVVVALTATMFVVDNPGVGGDVDLQFAFRLSQGWDLLADITGLFESSDVAFGDRFEPSEERADVWPEYWQMFLDNPVLGVGLGVGWLSNSILQEPHNLVLELLAETGIVGLVGFVALIVIIARAGSGRIAASLMVVAFLPSMTQTVLFEPTWWFAAGIYLSTTAIHAPVTSDGPKRQSLQTPLGG